MIEKLLEAFFRHAALIILPIFTLPLVVTAAVLSTPPQYEAQAGVWVERPTYLNYGPDDINRYLPPATVQRNQLTELLRTRSFVSAVLGETSVADVAKTPGQEGVADEIFGRDVDVVQNGDHLLLIRARAEERELALQLVNALISEFRARAYEDRLLQAQLAINFYQTRVNDAEAALAQARTDLAKYVKGNSGVAAALQDGGIEAARLDPQFAESQRRVDGGQRDADSARQSLGAAQLEVSAGQQSQTLWFRVVDAPGVSATATRQIKRVLIYPLVALMGGILLAAGMLMFFALSDHSVRTMADLAPDAVILGSMPRLRPKRVARGAGPHVTRRAIGYLAGSVLPLREERNRS